jgi:4-amino-4-deoxy-L-arabinose transferase-like glycosyltransferase
MGEIAVISFLLIWGLFLRLPFFFPATIDWDESTFTIIGQGILDGLLPYDTLWENKPPLVFVFFAAAITLFGKTIFAVRFAGYLWLTAAAYLIYKSAYTLTSERRASIAAALLLITETSLMSPSVMSEILALLPLVSALFLLLRSGVTTMTCFFAGVLIGISVMFRTNLAYLAVLLGIYLILYPPIHIRRCLGRGLVYAIGGTIVILALAIPYLIQHRLELWSSSVFLVPLNYSSSQQSFSNAQRLIWDAFGLNADSIVLGIPLDIPMFVTGCLLWIGGLLGVSFCFLKWRDLPGRKRNQFIVLLVFLIGSAFSVFLGGQAHDHYLIQLYPWLAIFSSLALIFQPTATRRVIEPVVLLLIISSTIIFVFSEYSGLSRRIIESKSLSYGPEYEIAGYLEQENPEKKTVFLLSDIVVYWLIDQYPPTRLSAHPSNVFKPDLVAAVEGRGATPLSELLRILSMKPAFVVTKKNQWYLVEGEAASTLLTDTLKSDYVLVKVMDGREIYRLREP